MGWNYWFVVVLLVIAVAVAPALKQKRIRLLAIGWQAGLLFSLVTYCVVALTVK
jgi:hypothetical protein